MLCHLSAYYATFGFSFLSNLPIFKNFQTSYTWFFPVFCFPDRCQLYPFVSLEARTYENTRHKNMQGGDFKVKSTHSTCLPPCCWKMSNWTQALSWAAMTSKPLHRWLCMVRRAKSRHLPPIPLVAFTTGAAWQCLLLCGALASELVFPSFHSWPPPWNIKIWWESYALSMTYRNSLELGRKYQGWILVWKCWACMTSSFHLSA